MARRLLLGTLVLILVECAACGAGRMTAAGRFLRSSSSGGVQGALRRPMRLKGGDEAVGESGGAPAVPPASSNDGEREFTVVTQKFISNKVGPESQKSPRPSDHAVIGRQSQLQPRFGGSGQGSALGRP